MFCSASSDFHHSVLQVSYLFFCHSYSAIDFSYSVLFTPLCSLVLQGLGKHFLHLLHSVSKILGHLDYHYSEFFFWKLPYFHYICFCGVLSCPFIWDVTQLFHPD